MSCDDVGLGLRFGEETGFNREKLKGTKPIQPAHSNSSLALAQAHFFVKKKKNTKNRTLELIF